MSAENIELSIENLDQIHSLLKDLQAYQHDSNFDKIKLYIFKE